jgi:hypothetical protein
VQVHCHGSFGLGVRDLSICGIYRLSWFCMQLPGAQTDWPGAYDVYHAKYWQVSEWVGSLVFALLESVALLRYMCSGDRTVV